MLAVFFPAADRAAVDRLRDLRIAGGRDEIARCGRTRVVEKLITALGGSEGAVEDSPTAIAEYAATLRDHEAALSAGDHERLYNLALAEDRRRAMTELGR